MALKPQGQWIYVDDPLIPNPVAAPSLTEAASSTTAATAQQLLARTTVGPSGTHGRRRRQQKVVAKFYNEMAGRPFPRVGSPYTEYKAQLEASNTGFFVTSTTVPVYLGRAFTLADGDNAVNFMSLFDQYKITKVEVWLEPQAALGTTAFGVLYSTVDLDDANTPTNYRSVNAHQSALVGLGGAGRYHAWQPNVATALYSGVFTSFGNEPAGWIDVASPSVQHFGLKIASPPTPTVVTYVLSLRLTVSFRGAATA